jgi:hypothetical protein
VKLPAEKVILRSGKVPDAREIFVFKRERVSLRTVSPSDSTLAAPVPFGLKV